MHISQNNNGKQLNSGIYIDERVFIGNDLSNESLKKIGTGKIGFLGDNIILYTDSLGPCFPVIFKLKDNDIVLYHGFHSAVDHNHPLKYLLLSGQVKEIEIFSKEQPPRNRPKVLDFIKNIARFCAEKAPSILINHQELRRYEHVFCYKNSSHQPVIVIGEKGPPEEKNEDKEYKEDEEQSQEIKKINQQPKSIITTPNINPTNPRRILLSIENYFKNNCESFKEAQEGLLEEMHEFYEALGKKIELGFNLDTPDPNNKFRP